MSGAVQLVQLAVVGTAALIGLGFWLKLGKTTRLSGPDEAHAHLMAWNPDLQVGEMVLSFDKDAALARGADGAIYGVFVLGDSVSVRKFSSADLVLLGPERAYIQPRDIGFPPRSFAALKEGLASLGLSSLVAEVINAKPA